MAEMDKHQVWQRNKSLKERNEIMFRQELATDITFRVSSLSEGIKTTIKAHKYMLISSSSVFWSMFCGGLPESEDVEVSDVEPDVFKEMLRFIYTEQSRVTGDNVMHMIHAAKKYDIPALVQQCVDYMHKSLDSNNVFTILDHSQFFAENDLSQKCMDYIEKHTSEALQSEAFLGISQDTLAFVLENDKLNMKEVDILRLCCKWAEKKTNETSPREALGKALYKIRFPVMTASEFTKDVRPTKVLTNEEQLEIYSYLTVPEDENKTPHFSCVARKRRDRPLVIGDRVRVKKSVCTPAMGWGKKGANHESIGELRSINGNNITIDFLNNQGWMGYSYEIEMV